MSYYQSAENIYNQMKLYITNVDTSKNSYIYNALFPVAMEIANSLLGLDDMESKVFASKAVTAGYSKYLDLRVSEVGLTRKIATYATIPVTFTGKVGTVINSGSIVSTNDNRLYTTTSNATIGNDGTVTCNVIADASGSSYNVNAGEICYLPVKYSGVTSVTNESAYNSAIDKESDDDLYARYLVQVQNSTTSGNKAHFKSWALSVDGIGSAIVYPLKDENLQDKNGCVTIVIANSNNRACDQTLIDSVESYVTSQMPIGVMLSVLSVSELNINISCTLTYDSIRYSLDTIQTNIETAISDYLEGLDVEATSIKYNRLLSIIMDVDGISDVNNLLINNGVSNIDLSEIQVPVIGTVTISV